MISKMIITDYYDLLALYKTMFEAKFHPDPNNCDIAGSPIVSDLLNRVLDELIEEQSKNDVHSHEKWNNWLKICNHMPSEKQPKSEITVWEIAIANAKRDSRFWEDYSNEKLREIAECYLCPFKCTPEELDLFICSVKKMN